jgi:hypothetical protein
MALKSNGTGKLDKCSLLLTCLKIEFCYRVGFGGLTVAAVKGHKQNMLHLQLSSGQLLARLILRL